MNKVAALDLYNLPRYSEWYCNFFSSIFSAISWLMQGCYGYSELMLSIRYNSWRCIWIYLNISNRELFKPFNVDKMNWMYVTLLYSHVAQKCPKWCDISSRRLLCSSPVRISPAPCGRSVWSGWVWLCSRNVRWSCRPPRPRLRLQLRQRQIRPLSLAPPRPLPAACCLNAWAEGPGGLPPEHHGCWDLQRHTDRNRGSANAMNGGKKNLPNNGKYNRSNGSSLNC